MFRYRHIQIRSVLLSRHSFQVDPFGLTIVQNTLTGKNGVLEIFVSDIRFTCVCREEYSLRASRED